MRLNEGIIKVPKEWINLMEEKLTAFFAVRAYYSLMLDIYGKASSIKSIEDMIAGDSNSSGKLQGILDSLVSQFESLKEDVARFGDEYEVYDSMDIDSRDFFDPREETSTLAELSSLPSIRQIGIFPEKNEFKNYNIPASVILPAINIQIDLSDIKTDLHGQIDYRSLKYSYVVIDLSGVIFSKHSFAMVGSYKSAKKELQSLVASYLNIFEHEAIHYIQKFVLPADQFYDSIDNAAYKEHGDYYLRTNLEFQPQIVSSYDRFINFSGSNNPEENLRLFIMQDYFFEALTVGSKKWKEAVKLLYLYIMSKEE